MVHHRDVGSCPAGAERHPQRVEHQRRAHVARELPAHDAAAVGVEHEREEQKPLPATQVGQIRQPEPIRRRRREVAPDDVRAPARDRIRSRRAPRLAAPLGAPDAVGAHQPLDAIATDIDALAAQRLPRAPVTVGVVVGGVHAFDLADQPLVLDARRDRRPLRRW
jgi:hypothetical protein